MPKLPVLNGGNTTREVIDIFAGYNHNLKIQDGEFYFTENLTSDFYPLMANRKPRGILNLVPEPYPVYPGTVFQFPEGTFCTHNGKTYKSNTTVSNEVWDPEHWDEVENIFANMQGIISKTAYPRAPYFVGNGHLYGEYGSNPMYQEMRPLLPESVSAGEKQLVSFGSYICVFPDKMYYNTEDPDDHGRMDVQWSFYGSGVKYTMCHQDGSEYASVSKSNTAPQSPAAGDVWIDTTDGVAKEYSSSSEWITLETVYTKVDFGNNADVSSHFKEFDGVEISGMHFDDLNGSKILYKVDEHAVVLIGILEANYTESSMSDISIKRLVPDMDYVCEAQNRLWGCKYGVDSETGKTVNEIYCCALGDFKNWSQYLGVATDSWRASRGSDGPWTGCINYLGSPTFFKENVIHPVTVSPVGAHQIGDIPGRGVQNGSWRSLAIVNETLYYKADTGVLAYQGGLPVNVSAALGGVEYKNAVAGAVGQKYYISMQEGSSWNLFCYDASKGIWMREDDLHVECFAQIGDQLYMQTSDNIYMIKTNAGSKKEADPGWIAESGIQHYQYPDKKYVSRYNISLQLAKGASMKMYIQYDSKGPWVFVGNVENGDNMTDNTGTANVPVKPRRCDHLRLRFEGTGDVRVLSITRLLQKGSDM